MNKYELINAVLISDLRAEDKTLLIELIMRADENGYCWPSVERLCMVRGIKYEKNFKGADKYLPGLVSVGKAGRKNTYTLNVPAIKALGTTKVTLKHTPAVEGVYTPAVADNTPAVADNTPAVEGANSTKNNKRIVQKESTSTTVPDGPVVVQPSNEELGRERYSFKYRNGKPSKSKTYSVYFLNIEDHFPAVRRYEERRDLREYADDWVKEMWA